MEIARPGQYLSFELASMAYALPIGLVREINRVQPISPMPETPPYVAGVMNLRGRLIPILDLKMRFSMPSSPNTKQSCIIVVESDSGLCGLLVDNIFGVVTITADHIEPRPGLTKDDPNTCVNGIGKSGDQILVMLEITRILSPDLKLSLEKVA